MRDILNIIAVIVGTKVKKGCTFSITYGYILELGFSVSEFLLVHSFNDSDEKKIVPSPQVKNERARQTVLAALAAFFFRNLTP